METVTLAPITIDPKTFLYHHCALPALPKVLTRFQEALRSDDVTISRVVNIISSDPGIVAEVLKLVNSAYYSLPRDVSRLDMAVAYLGLQEVHNIVMTSSVVNTFELSNSRAFKKLWHHSLYTALCARYLASRYERHLPFSELWVPALLHDVGKLVYLKFFPDHFKALCQYAEDQGCLFEEAEQAHGMPSNAYLGGLLCERWRLPRKIKTVCAMPEAQALAGLRNSQDLQPLHRVIALADFAATVSTDRLQKDTQLFLSDTIMQALDLTEAEFLVLMGALSDLKLEADRLAG